MGFDFFPIGESDKNKKRVLLAGRFKVKWADAERIIRQLIRFFAGSNGRICSYFWAAGNSCWRW